MRAPNRWDRWDDEVANGASPVEVLARLPDEVIVELLRCADRQRRDYERDLLMVELGNRVIRLRREVAEIRALANEVVTAMERRGAAAEALFGALSDEIPPHLRREGVALAQEAREHAARLHAALEEAERRAFARARDR